MRRWWDERRSATYPEDELADYRAAIAGRDPTHRYVIDLDGAPVGIIQHYRIGDDPDYAAALALEEDAVGADLFIGEADRIGRGIGPTALRQFLLEVAFPFHRLEVCVIGPSVRNTSAIRAYEKIGFRPLRDVLVPGEADAEHVMRASRADLAE